MRRKQITSIVLSLVLASSAFCSPFAQVPAYAAEEVAEAAEAEDAAEAAEADAEVTEETAAEDVNTAVSGDAVNDEAETGISGEEAVDVEAEVNDEVNDEGVSQDYQQNADTSENTEEAIEEAVSIQDETYSEPKDGNAGDSIFEGTVSVTTKSQEATPEAGDGKSSEDLFAEYVDRSFGVRNGQSGQAPSGRKRAPKSAASSLIGIERAVYDEIAACLPAIAAGERASTEFEIDVDDLGLEKTFWTAGELGIPTIFAVDESGNMIIDDEGNATISDEAIEAIDEITSYDLLKVIHALLADHPYQLYWYEKTQETTSTGCEITAFYDDMIEDYQVGIDGSFTISLPVADEYSAGEYMVDTSIGQNVQTSVANANAIVTEYGSATDYEKLCGYRDEICDLVSYNDVAAGGGVSYGDPWQMIWVFDGNPDTNVVCEGYSKAFKYLCDQSEFSGDISCITVTGTMTGGTGEGPHMWNIVNMEDGKNYLVDVTNCDEGTVGAPDELLLAGCSFGNIDEGYTYSCANGDVIYTYDLNVLELYDDLTMSDTKYEAEGFEYTEGNLIYEISSRNATVVGYVGSPTEVIIPESVNGATVISIAENAFRECESLESVTIPRTLKRLEGEAVYSVSFDYEGTTDQIETFAGFISGDGAFYECHNLTTFIIPEDSQLEHIGACTFYRTGISNIELPDTVAFIGPGAFYDCDSLASITVPRRVETIEPFAISHCDNLRTITIESDIMKEIGLMGFAQSIRFASIVIPESVERIDELAFYDCTQLQSVMIPQNVSQIDSTSFADCFYLESINVDDANEFYTSVDGVLYDKEISTVICCPGNISGNWVLPDSVTAIEPFACFGSVHVTEITLPQSLESIELAAFSNCFALEKINIPSKVTELPEKTFLNCYNLSEIDYQGTVSVIGDYCFCGCGFTSIDGAWPENLNTIVKGAFRANQLRTLEIPSHVTFIEDDAFSNNELLADVNISEELLSLIDVESVFWNTLYLGFSGEVGNNATYLRKGHKLTISGYGPTFDYTFDPPTGGEEVEEVEIEEGITSLGTRVLACKRYGIESIIIPVSVQQINEDCFDRTWINEITILSPICTIDCELNCQILYGYDQSTAEAYANNHELVTFVSLGEAPHVDPIDDNVKASGSCGENADWNLDNGVLTISGIGETDDWTDWSETPWFEYRDYIKSIIVQEGITKIGNYAFSKCASLNDISLNEGLLRIGECAFLECSKLNAITIPQSVIEIGCAAFSVNSKLSSIVLPDQLTIIADNLFTSCSNLSDIVIPESVTSIGEWAFSGCDKLKKITIPENTEIIGQFAFSGSGIESITIPNGVSVIDEYTFFGCRFLSSIIIPQNITHIYRQAFYRCPNLNTIIFEGDMPYISPSEVFGEVTATIYYPGDNETWAGASLDTYNGNIEWKPYYSDEETKIVSHPTDVQAKSGEQVSLHVEAEGKNLRYQWQWSTDGERWKNCTSAGYNTDTFSFVMKDTLNGRHYRCVVTSGDEQVISQAALITFVSEEELEITSQPQNVTVGIGKIVSVHIEVNNADAAYQWQWSSDGTTWKNCMSAGYNTDTFSFNMKASLSGRQYRCKVTCERETLVSDAATITLSVRPEIISQPADVVASVGETVTFTVGVQGDAPVYQWQWSANGTTWKNCSSAGFNTDTFSFKMKETLSGRQYRCRVTCGGETLISDAVTITLSVRPEIINQPSDVEAGVGETVTFTVGVQGEDPDYQWQWSANGTTWKNCTSAGYNTDTFSFKMKETLSGRRYRCRVTFGGETLISDAATITLPVRPEIISQPADVQAAAGEIVTITVGVQGEDPVYQWQWSADGTTWKNCSSVGYNTDTFSFTMKATLSGRQYRCKVTCGGETLISEAGTITLRENAVMY